MRQRLSSSTSRGLGHHLGRINDTLPLTNCSRTQGRPTPIYTAVLTPRKRDPERGRLDPIDPLTPPLLRFSSPYQRGERDGGWKQHPRIGEGVLDPGKEFTPPGDGRSCRSYTDGPKVDPTPRTPGSLHLTPPLSTGVSVKQYLDGVPRRGGPGVSCRRDLEMDQNQTFVFSLFL